MPRLLIIMMVATVISCSKSHQSKDDAIASLTNTWLVQKKSELSGCTCLTAIYKGKYLGEVIYEIRVIDPLCNGVNVVYKIDGTLLLNSGDQSAYQSYISAVQNLQSIWSCSQSE